MHIKELEEYLHEHIPLSEAMQVSVIEADTELVRLAAPLAPNINHRETLFGGSASAVAILAAWTILYIRLQKEGLYSRVVIQRNQMSYDKPVAGDFFAAAKMVDDVYWQKFLKQLKRHHRARISVTSMLEYNGETAGTMTGDFVAINL
ncbi:MAG: YiiD C-terminal domain-containing protein [Acidiferrobacterales bacterium]